MLLIATMGEYNSWK